MALTSLSQSLHPHPLPMGPGASCKLRPGSPVSSCGVLQVYASLHLQLHHSCAWPWTLLFWILTYKFPIMIYDPFQVSNLALGAAPRILNKAPCPSGCPASGAPQGWPGPFFSSPLSLQSSPWATRSTPQPPSPGFKLPWRCPFPSFLTLSLLFAFGNCPAASHSD